MSCTELLPIRWREPVAAGSKEPFEVDFEDKLAFRRADKRVYGVNDQIRLPNGFDAKCTTAGWINELAEPKWPSVDGSPVLDGSVIWQIVARTADSLRATVPASGFVWTPPAGVAVSGQDDSTTKTTADLGVTSDTEPGDYTINVKATDSNGNIWIQPCILSVQ